MNRMEEWNALQRELAPLPPALEGCVDRARRRLGRHRLRRALEGAAAGLASLAACFVVLVNCSAPFALACAGIPLLRELAAAVSFSPGLRAAAEHGYVQQIGQSETDGGFTVYLDSLVMDRSQVSFFLKVTPPAGWDRFDLMAEVADGAGERLENAFVISHLLEPDVLAEAATLNLTEGALPDTLRLTLSLYPWTNDLARETTAAQVEFIIPLDSALTAAGEIIPVNRWLELEGQNLLVESVSINPTNAQVVLRDHPDNTKWLTELDACLVDADGNTYAPGTSVGLSMSGSLRDSGSMALYFESPYFGSREGLALRITGCAWLDKDLPPITLDLETGEADWLPQDTSIVRLERQGAQTLLTLRFPKRWEPVRQLLELSCLAPDGSEHSGTAMSFYTREEDPGYVYNTYHLETGDWPWIQLRPNWSSGGVLETPVELPLP